MKGMLLKLPILLLTITAIVFSSGICTAAEDPFARFIKPVTNPVYFDEAQNRSYVHVVNGYQNLAETDQHQAGTGPS